jgi:hypothetical protein
MKRPYVFGKQTDESFAIHTKYQYSICSGTAQSHTSTTTYQLSYPKPAWFSAKHIIFP